jgi:hypothetical protein
MSQRTIGINWKAAAQYFSGEFVIVLDVTPGGTPCSQSREKMYRVIFITQQNMGSRGLSLTFAREAATLGYSQSQNISLTVPKGSCRIWLFKLDEEVGQENIFKQMF